MDRLACATMAVVVAIVAVVFLMVVPCCGFGCLDRGFCCGLAAGLCRRCCCCLLMFFFFFKPQIRVLTCNLNCKFIFLFAVIKPSCHLMREVDHHVRKCPYTYGVVLRFINGDLLQICIASRPRPSFGAGVVEPSTDIVACMDLNDSDTRNITIFPFYFSLGFRFLMSRFFNRVFHATDYAPSQCTPNVYQAVICFDNLNCFFEVRRCEKYTQLCACKEKLFDIQSADDHV